MSVTPSDADRILDLDYLQENCIRCSLWKRRSKTANVCCLQIVTVQTHALCSCAIFEVDIYAGKIESSCCVIY